MRQIIALFVVLLLVLPSSAATAFFRMGPGGPVAAAPVDLPPAITFPDDAISMSFTGEVVDENLPPGMSHGFDPEGDCTPECPCIARTWQNYGEGFARLYATDCQAAQISPNSNMQSFAASVWPANTTVLVMHP